MIKEFFDKGDKLMRDNSEFIKRESKRIDEIGEGKRKVGNKK